MKDGLERFLEAQKFRYDCAFEETRNGKKTGHSIWYVFPQMRGLVHSSNSNYFCISSIDEARA